MNDADRLELPPAGPEELNEIWDEVGHEMELMGERMTVYSHYDKSGNPISMRDWCRLRRWDEENGREYTIVAQTTVGDLWISTVWLGIDYGYGFPKPQIFETMCFRRSTGESDLDCWRYSTEEEAKEGHARMVAQARVMESLA